MWSFLGGLASGLLGGLFGFGAASQQQSYNTANTAQQHKYNLETMKKAQEYNKELAKYNQNLQLQNLQQSPGALRTGMENAGFNPVLAYSNGSFTNATSPGSQPALGSSLPSSPKPDYSSAVTNAVNSYTALKQQHNQDILANAQVANIKADSELKDMMSSSESVKQMLGLSEQELTWTRIEQNNLDNQLRKKEINWYEYKQRREDLRLDVERIKARAQQAMSYASLQNADTNAVQLGINRYRADADVRYINEKSFYHGAQNPWTRGHWFMQNFKHLDRQRLLNNNWH